MFPKKVLILGHTRTHMVTRAEKSRLDFIWDWTEQKKNLLLKCERFPRKIPQMHSDRFQSGMKLQSFFYPITVCGRMYIVCRYKVLTPSWPAANRARGLVLSLESANRSRVVQQNICTTRREIPWNVVILVLRYAEKKPRPPEIDGKIGEVCVFSRDPLLEVPSGWCYPAVKGGKLCKKNPVTFWHHNKQTSEGEKVELITKQSGDLGSTRSESWPEIGTMIGKPKVHFLNHS